jgi:hypothetical protein
MSVDISYSLRVHQDREGKAIMGEGDSIVSDSTMLHRLVNRGENLMTAIWVVFTNR